jgi:hypothetical protein
MKLDKAHPAIPTDLQIQKYTFHDTRYLVYLRAGLVEYEQHAHVWADLRIEALCTSQTIELVLMDLPAQICSLVQPVISFDHFRAERTRTVALLQNLASEKRLCELIPAHFYHIN